VDFEDFDRPTRRSVVKDADCKPPGVPGKRIKVGPVLFEDRPMYMLMVPVHDVALAMARFRALNTGRGKLVSYAYPAVRILARHCLPGFFSSFFRVPIAAAYSPERDIEVR
jgi:hypothetical protein